MLHEQLRAHYEPIPSDIGDKLTSDGSSWAGTNIHSSDTNKDSRYIIGPLIDFGGNAGVYIGYDRKLVMLVAIKMSNQTKIGSTDLATIQQFEAMIHASQEHNPYVIRIYGHKTITKDDKQTSATIFEYLNPERYKTVNDLINEKDMSLVDIANILEQSSAGLDIQHGHRHPSDFPTLHADITARNMFYDKTNKIFKYGDFGAIAMRKMLKNDNLPVLVGTLPYMSPEAFNCEAESSSDDRWGHAIVAFELITGQKPFALDFIRTSADATHAVISANGLSEEDKTLLQDHLTNMKINSVDQRTIIDQFDRAYQGNKHDRFQTAQEFTTPIVQIFKQASSI